MTSISALRTQHSAASKVSQIGSGAAAKSDGHLDAAVTWPRARSAPAVRDLEGVAGLLGPAMPSNLWLSAAWPTRPVELPVTTTGSGPRNVLIPQNTRNPSTSLRSARGLRAVLGRRAAMVTVDQGGHGVFGLGNCADEVTNAFLATAAMAIPLAYPVRSCVMATAPAVRGRTSTPAGTRPHPWPAPTPDAPEPALHRPSPTRTRSSRNPIQPATFTAPKRSRTASVISHSATWRLGTCWGAEGWLGPLVVTVHRNHDHLSVGQLRHIAHRAGRIHQLPDPQPRAEPRGDR
jgi:hypothetical protein